MNVLKQIHIDNSDSDIIEKLETLRDEFYAEEYENANGDPSRRYNARRRYRRFLNKLSGSQAAECHMITSNGWNSNGDKTLVIGN